MKHKMPANGVALRLTCSCASGCVAEELNLTPGEQPDAQSGQPDARTVEILRAEEYEHLAKLCLDKKQ